jgi:hypothetical protein
MTEINEMIPYERDVFAEFIVEDIKDKERNKQQ